MLAGVLLHLPMFIDAAAMDFELVGMPIDWHMQLGMTLIVGGTVAGWYGLLPPGRRRGAPDPVTMDPVLAMPAQADGTLRWIYWRLMLVLALALVIDLMKPASLGFTIPGMMREYGLSRETIALFPFFALTGLTIGSYMWGVIADQVGRRAAILLSGIMFVGTAICGTMPGFLWNLAMCFFMGLAAGGMLPIAYTLLAECIPPRQRGWALVLLGGFGLIGGYFAASGCAALLEPHFGWRIMWLLNAPTGVMLILCNYLIPELPRFLLMRGRVEELRITLARFGVPLDLGHAFDAAAARVDSTLALLRRPFSSTTLALNLTGVSWGLVNFGLLLWLPAELRARGYGVAGSDILLFRSALLALPTMPVVAWLYGRWSTKWTVVALSVTTALGLVGLSLIDFGHRHVSRQPAGNGVHPDGGRERHHCLPSSLQRRELSGPRARKRHGPRRRQQQVRRPARSGDHGRGLGSEPRSCLVGTRRADGRLGGHARVLRSRDARPRIGGAGSASLVTA